MLLLYFILNKTPDFVLNQQVELFNDQMHDLLHSLGNLGIDSFIYVLEVVLNCCIAAFLLEE